MPNRYDRPSSILDALAEANDQFHWGTKVADVEAAARRLRALGLNPALTAELEAKVVRMRTIQQLLRDACVAPSSRPDLAKAGPLG